MLNAGRGSPTSGLILISQFVAQPVTFPYQRLNIFLGLLMPLDKVFQFADDIACGHFRDLHGRAVVVVLGLGYCLTQVLDDVAGVFGHGAAPARRIAVVSAPV